MALKRFLISLVLCACVSLHAQTMVVPPYVQPGNGTTVGDHDVKVIAWLGDEIPGNYVFEMVGGNIWMPGPAIQRTPLIFSATTSYLKYHVELDSLPLNTEITYRVRLGGKVVGGGKFKTRHTPDQPVSFAVVGDMADGRAPSRKIAFQMAKAAPEFLLALGDIVYTKGTLAEYLTKYFPVFQAPPPGNPEVGAPLLRSVPVYPVLGNHDVGITSLETDPDGYAVFYLFYPPLNGPATNAWATPIRGPADQVAAFKALAGQNYPRACNYSFDNGPVHCLVLDANPYVGVTDAAFRQWIHEDLTKSALPWKMVFFHHPGFSTAEKHFTEQRMRLLAPLFEECGVNLVLSGHVHGYQRSKPLTFHPTEDRISMDGTVAGEFHLDEEFDGKVKTVPQGIIYIVTGGGGATLYNPDYTDKPEKWRRPLPSWAPFTARYVSDRNSFTMIDASATELVLRQLDSVGEEIERIRVTKPVVK